MSIITIDGFESSGVSVTEVSESSIIRNLTLNTGFYYAPYIPLLSQKYIRNEILGISDEELVNSLDAVKYFRKKNGVEVTEDTISFN